MIKILFLIPGLSEGGAEKVLCNLVNNMNQGKFDITVQTLYEYDHKKYLKPGIHYKSIFKCKNKLIKKISYLWYRFCTEFRLTYPLYIKDDYDIEVAYMECGVTKVMAASTNKKASKLAWVHCDLEKRGLIDDKLKEYYSKYDKVVCVSKDVEKSFDRLYGEYAESVVIRNVIDENEIISKSKEKNVNWEVDGDCKRFIAVGRLVEVKNFAHLINVCKKLKESGMALSLKILGDGPLMESLNEQIRTLGLEDEVELLGFKDNPYPWIKATDYVVCSSLYEGMSTVVQEALVLEKIVITTPCAGMEELLGEAHCGLIADSDEDGLFREIQKVFNNPELNKQLKDNIRICRNNNNMINTVKNTESFFESFLSEN